MSKLHPLHEPEALLHGMLANHEYPDKVRRTGRSTALALKYIAEAIENPYQTVRLRDHQHEHSNTYQCRAGFAEYVLATAQKLQLSHLKARTINGEFYLQFGE